jgi:hypothetical protein
MQSRQVRCIQAFFMSIKTKQRRKSSISRHLCYAEHGGAGLPPEEISEEEYQARITPAVSLLAHATGWRTQVLAATNEQRAEGGSMSPSDTWDASQSFLEPPYAASPLLLLSLRAHGPDRN